MAREGNEGQELDSHNNSGVDNLYSVNPFGGLSGPHNGGSGETDT